MSPPLKNQREFLKKLPSPNPKEDSPKTILKIWSEKPRLLKEKMKKSSIESKAKMHLNLLPIKLKINLVMKKLKLPSKKPIKLPSLPRLMKPSSGSNPTNKPKLKPIRKKPKNLKKFSIPS